MSLKEKEQILVFEQLKRKEITQILAAKILKKSERWVRKKIKPYRRNGDQGIVHKNKGRPRKRAWNKKEPDFAIDLFKGDFINFEPT